MAQEAAQTETQTSAAASQPYSTGSQQTRGASQATEETYVYSSDPLATGLDVTEAGTEEAEERREQEYAAMRRAWPDHPQGVEHDWCAAVPSLLDTSSGGWPARLGLLRQDERGATSPAR